MHQRHPDIERAQHRHIQEDVGKILARHDLAIHADDKNLFAEARYILQDFPQIGQFHNSVFKFQLSDGAILIRAGRKCKMQNAEQNNPRLSGIAAAKGFFGNIHHSSFIICHLSFVISPITPPG
jgi:hypothetical protein